MNMKRFFEAAAVSVLLGSISAASFAQAKPYHHGKALHYIAKAHHGKMVHESLMERSLDGLTPPEHKCLEARLDKMAIHPRTVMEDHLVKMPVAARRKLALRMMHQSGMKCMIMKHHGKMVMHGKMNKSK